MPDVGAVFFDLGDTLGTPILSGDPVRLVSFEVFPFVPHVLSVLRDRGMRLGIISNTGSDGAAVIDPIIDRAGILDFFKKDLRIYSAEVALRKDSPAIFELAAKRTSIPASNCIFVGEDGAERAFAVRAGMRVAPHPLLVGEVLDGHAMRYVRVDVPAANRDQVLSTLSKLPFVALHRSGASGLLVYGVTSQRTAVDLINMGLNVGLLGDLGLPDSADLYLLRDDIAAASGFMSNSGEASRFFGSAETGRLLMTSDPEGVVVALPDGRSPGDFHFAEARHGHTLKLIPDPLLLLELRPKDEAGGAAFGGDLAGATLNEEEVCALAGIDAESVLDLIGRYSGLAPLSSDDPLPVESRHIAHKDNARAVAAIAKDLQSAGAGRVEVTHLQFSHRGLVLHNVQGELPGTEPGVVLITAHLDSTAANDDHFDEAHG